MELTRCCVVFVFPDPEGAGGESYSAQQVASSADRPDGCHDWSSHPEQNFTSGKVLISIPIVFCLN